MPIEINVSASTSILETYNAQAASAAGQNASGQAPVSEEEAYKVSTGAERSSKFQVDYDKINALKADYRKGYTAFRQMVSALFQKQGEATRSILERIFGENGNFEGVTNLGETLASLQVDEETRAEAASLIGEDGAWGVKQVSQNILSFAKAAAGGDPEKLETMKNAFLKGFAEAERVWGGKLPEISYKTKEAVLAGFDELQGAKSE